MRLLQTQPRKNGGRALLELDLLTLQNILLCAPICLVVAMEQPGRWRRIR